MFAGFAYTERVPVKFATILYEVGNTWMIAFLYLLIVFLLADIASLCHLLPKTLLKDSAAGLLGAVGIVALVMTLGAIHYPHKYREELTLETDKPLEKPLTIVLASDLHIGYHNRKAELGRWVDLINAEKPARRNSGASRRLSGPSSAITRPMPACRRRNSSSKPPESGS